MSRPDRTGVIEYSLSRSSLGGGGGGGLSGGGRITGDIAAPRPSFELAAASDRQPSDLRRALASTAEGRSIRPSVPIAIIVITFRRSDPLLAIGLIPEPVSLRDFITVGCKRALWAGLQFLLRSLMQA